MHIQISVDIFLDRNGIGKIIIRKNLFATQCQTLSYVFLLEFNDAF